MFISSLMPVQRRDSRRGGREGTALYSLSKLENNGTIYNLCCSPTKMIQHLVLWHLHVCVDAAGWINLIMWKIQQFNHRGQTQILSGGSKAVTSLASRTSEDRTSESLLSSGDSNRKSNTRSMTMSFSGGVRRGKSSNSAVWFGDRSWRTSSCAQQRRKEKKNCSAEKTEFII